jgi:hypothetical protein
MSDDPEDATTDAERVTRALEGLRSAVRQSQAELAGLGSTEALHALLRDLRDREQVHEPTPPIRPSLGGRISASARRAAYRLLFRWHARIVWKQQSEFNRTATRLLQDLVERERDRAAALARLEDRLEQLERLRRGGAAG